MARSRIIKPELYMFVNLDLEKEKVALKEA